MKKQSRIWLFSGLVLIAASCNKKEFCDSLDPYGSNAELRYDWTSGCCIPEEVEVRLLSSSGELLSMQTSSGSAFLKLPLGNYQVLAYEKPKNIQLNGNIARLIALPDGTFAQPGDFSAGTCCIDVTKWKPCSSIIMMRRQFGRLKLSIETSGKDAALVSQMEGKLSGIALARDISSNCCVKTRSQRENGVQQAGSVKFGLQQDQNSYTGSVNYLGVPEDSEQLLSIRLEYADGSSQTLEMDATEHLSNPENETGGASKPSHLAIGLEVEQVKGVFSAKIVDWSFEAGGNLEAEETNQENNRK